MRVSRTLAIVVAAGSMLLTVATASPALAGHGGGSGGGGQPPPGTALQSELYGASCTSASACTAVGDYVTSTGASKTLAERWNGTAWTLQSTPNPSGGSAQRAQRVNRAGHGRRHVARLRTTSNDPRTRRSRPEMPYGRCERR